jgi:hypothetical protein
MDKDKKLNQVFIWDGCNSEDIDKYILGGTNVKLKTSHELLISNTSKTDEILDVSKKNFGKVINYYSSVFIPFFINGYSIITRWVNRPERNPNEFHNWSKLSLIHVEFAGLTVILANFFSNMLYLFGCLLMDCIYRNNKPTVSENLLKNLSGQICFLIALPLLLFSMWKVSIIVYEECGFFLTHIQNVNNNVTITNSTMINYGEDTKLGNIDYIPFLTLGIIMFLRKLCRNIQNYNRYSKFVKHKKNTEDDSYLNFTLYDPRAIKCINYNIQSIGKFSLLKVIVWTKHQLPTLVKKTIFLINSHLKSEEKDQEKEKEYKEFNKSCWICIYFSYLITCIVAIPFTIPVLMIFIIIFGVSFLSLVIKVGQISFVGELEVLDWKQENLVQFIAFLNNILSLDTGKIQSFDSIMTFMFSGEDAKEDKYEKLARKRFINGLINHSVEYQGLLKTLIILPQIGTDQLQNIFIHEKKNNDNDSEDDGQEDNDSENNESEDNNSDHIEKILPIECP